MITITSQLHSNQIYAYFCFMNWDESKKIGTQSQAILRMSTFSTAIDVERIVLLSYWKLHIWSISPLTLLLNYLTMWKFIYFYVVRSITWFYFFSFACVTVLWSITSYNNLRTQPYTLKVWKILRDRYHCTNHFVTIRYVEDGAEQILLVFCK